MGDCGRDFRTSEIGDETPACACLQRSGCAARAARSRDQREGAVLDFSVREAALRPMGHTRGEFPAGFFPHLGQRGGQGQGPLPPVRSCGIGSCRQQEPRFPVVRWPRGSGGGTAGLPKVAAHFAAAIEAGKTPPRSIAFFHGLVEGMHFDGKDGSTPVDSVIVEDLVSNIDAAYRTIASRERRLGCKHTDLFRAIAIVGAGPMQAELIQAPARASWLRRMPPRLPGTRSCES